MDFLLLHGFENITWIFIAGLLSVFLMFMYFRNTMKENFVDLEIVQEVYGKSSTTFKMYFGVIIFITLLFFIALAGPYQDQKTEKIKRNGIDIEIVFDLSYSMIATDISPSRIEVAKEVLRNFIGEIQNDRVGLVLFSGKAFQSIPLSYDYSFIENFIAEMGVESINQQYRELQGTAIGDGLVLASNILTQKETDREKVIILITDGEANRGIDPELALKLLKEKNIKTYTIGVGKQGDTTIEMPLPGGFIQKVGVSGVDEVILKKISDETGGEFFRADSQKAFQDILDRIAKLEKKELETEQYSFHVSLLYLLVFPLLLSFILIFYYHFVKKIRL